MSLLAVPPTVSTIASTRQVGRRTVHWLRLAVAALTLTAITTTAVALDASDEAPVPVAGKKYI